MKKLLKISGITLAVLLLILLVGPFLVPIPPLEDVLPPQELADDDSLFVEINEFDFHYKTAGRGDLTVVMLHGFGASVYSWREVAPVLAENYTTYSYDRPAFGLTERPVEWEGDNPYTLLASVDQLNALLDAWGVEQVVLMGNSAGGTVALQYTFEHPERVLGLILVDPSFGGGGGGYSKYGWLLNTPQMQRLGPLLVREISKSGLETIDRAWHDPGKQPADTVPLYTKPLQAENWDVGLWLYSTAPSAPSLRERLGELSLPVLVLTGDNDRLIPAENTIAAAGEIPGAELVVLENCGHVPQEECPQAFLEAVLDFLARLPE
jgi:pimeloyl-ACP methyl ester carboxylesterase